MTYDEASQMARSEALRYNKTWFVLQCKDGTFMVATTPHFEETTVVDRIEGTADAMDREWRDEMDDDDDDGAREGYDVFGLTGVEHDLLVEHFEDID